ncbi:MAG TPA: HEAT repeat domain-containing protein [Crinalium sp.]
MQKISTSDSLAQIQLAVRQGDWSLVLYCLQHEAPSEETDRLSAESTPDPGALDRDALMQYVLELALETLESGDFQDRWDVAKVIPQLGERAIAPLLSLVQDDTADPDARWFAARVVAEFRDPTVLAALIKLLKTADQSDLQDIAISALAEFGTEAIAPLATLLDAPETRLLAAQALSKIRHSGTVSLLLSIVQDTQDSVRELAIEALSSFHDPNIPPVLATALRDPSAAVRRAAVAGLGFRSDLLDELDLVNVIQPLLLDIHPDVCQQAAIALSRLGTDAAASALFQMLRSPHTPTALRLDLVRSLGWIETPTAWNYLQQYLEGGANLDDPLIVQEAVTILGRVEAPPLKEKMSRVLLNLLQTEHPTIHHSTVRQAIALSLGQLENPAALDPLIQLLADDDWSVKLHAIVALKKLDAEAARFRLESLSHDQTLSPELSKGVAIALQEW